MLVYKEDLYEDTQISVLLIYINSNLHSILIDLNFESLSDFNRFLISNKIVEKLFLYFKEKESTVTTTRDISFFVNLCGIA